MEKPQRARPSNVEFSVLILWNARISDASVPQEMHLERPADSYNIYNIFPIGPFTDRSAAPNISYLEMTRVGSNFKVFKPSECIGWQGFTVLSLRDVRFTGQESPLRPHGRPPRIT